MRKFIVMILLSIVSCSAMAEWTKIGSTSDMTYYGDPSTIRKKGNLIKMWVLTDYKTFQETRGGKIKSMKNQEEYDCNEEQFRIVYVSSYFEGMGEGGVAENGEGSGKWLPIAPFSVGASKWKFACGVQ
jgi:hypothetical protein